jgi:hypothetical protein
MNASDFDPKFNEGEDVSAFLDIGKARSPGLEPAAEFYARLANDFGSDIDLEAVIRENRREKF